MVLKLLILTDFLRKGFEYPCFWDVIKSHISYDYGNKEKYSLQVHTLKVMSMILSLYEILLLSYLFIGKEGNVDNLLVSEFITY